MYDCAISNHLKLMYKEEVALNKFLFFSTLFHATKYEKFVKCKAVKYHKIQSFKKRIAWFVFIAIILILALPTSAKTYNKLGSTTLGKVQRRSNPTERCERIKIPLCKNIGYNFTNMNLSPTNYDEQEGAVQIVKQFTLLVDSKCANEMKLLICSVYAPICLTNYHKFLPPCRHICELARKGCEPLLHQYQTQWPELLRCDKYPIYSPKNQLCLHFNQTIQYETSTLSQPETRRALSATKNELQSLKIHHSNHSIISICTCAPPMVEIQNSNDLLFDKITTGTVPNCAFPCQSLYFGDVEFAFSITWITAWSTACFLVTLVTAATFLIDINRFFYPERPIIFISICYLFVSMGFLLRVVAGHEAVACGLGSDRILYGTTSLFHGPFLCSAIFLLIYFFGMAGSLWWVILTMTWFMAAGLKWGKEAISSQSKYFHLACWFIPGLQSITVLVTSSVDGDAVAGICYVGNQDINNLLRYVVIPLAVYLGVGGVLLLLGFANLFHIRNSMKTVGKITLPLDKLIVRIGFFSLINMGFSGTLVACHIYELLYRHQWETAHNCQIGSFDEKKSKPQLAIFLIKYSIIMFIGVANSWWIWSQKTITAWKYFYNQRCIYICGKRGLFTWLKQKPTKRSSKTNVISFSRNKPASSCFLLKNQKKLSSRNDDVIGT